MAGCCGRARRASGALALLLGGLLGLFGGLRSAPARAEHFPTPTSLVDAVSFWRDIYVRWSNQEIVFHDREDLSMVYRVVQVPPHGERREGLTRREHVARAEAELVAALASLERKQPASREGLTALEAEVFERLQPVMRADKYRRAALVRAQNGLRERALEGWARFGAHEAQVRAILWRAGLPEELIALAFVESLFDVRALSHAGAAGMWQFMPATGREYMQVHHALDERLDPLLATEAATRYLQQARELLGPWPVSITSYNFGKAGMARAIEAAGGADFNDILRRYDNPRFGFAARNYYACFLALVDVVRAPERYFPEAARVEPWNYDVLRLPLALRADHLAEAAGVSVEQLSHLNPSWTSATRKGTQVLPRGLALRVPLGRGERVLLELAQNRSRIHDAVRKHTRTWHRASGRESVAQIARRYGVEADELARTLKLSPRRRPRKGTKIAIPSTPLRFSLLPEARGLEVWDPPTTSAGVADLVNARARGESSLAALVRSVPGDAASVVAAAVPLVPDAPEETAEARAAPAPGLAEGAGELARERLLKPDEGGPGWVQADSPVLPPPREPAEPGEPALVPPLPEGPPS